MSEDWPYITNSLITKLEEVCPEKCADPNETLAQVHHYAGKRALVNFLISIHEEQNNKEQ